jgi:hypothetical protein
LEPDRQLANELLLKLGIRLSPRPVRRYMPSRSRHPKKGTQAWSTFVRNHARSVVASDFFVVATATFRIVYVLRVLKTPVRAPQANAFCEGAIGTIRRECMDFMLPHSRRIARTCRSLMACSASR